MKRTLKKSIAFALTLMLLFSCVYVQGFALFDKITDVKISSIEKFGWKEIQEYYDYLDEIGGATTDEDYYYNLDTTGEVTISTGEVIKVEEGYGYSKNEKRIVSVNAYVDVRDCKKARDSGKYKVKVYIETTLFSSIFINLDSKKMEKNVSFSETVVKKLSFASGKVEAYEVKDGYDYFFSLKNPEGLKFDIVYGDGTKKTAKVKKIISDGGYEYYALDGEEIYIEPDYSYNRNGKLYATVYFYDYEMRTSVKVEDFPVKSVKINKVTFDDKFNETKITYTIKTNDGKSHKITAEFGKDLVKSDFVLTDIALYEGKEFKGLPISVAVYSEVLDDEYPTQQVKTVMVSIDGVINETKTCEGPKEEATAIGEFIYKIRKLIENLFGEYLVF